MWKHLQVRNAQLARAQQQLMVNGAVKGQTGSQEGFARTPRKERCVRAETGAHDAQLQAGMHRRPGLEPTGKDSSEANQVPIRHVQDRLDLAANLLTALRAQAGILLVRQQEVCVVLQHEGAFNSRVVQVPQDAQKAERHRHFRRGQVMQCGTTQAPNDAPLHHLFP
jgi:hypothetical protein